MNPRHSPTPKEKSKAREESDSTTPDPSHQTVTDNVLHDLLHSQMSTDKVDLEEFDLKSALFRHMNKIKSANRNTANYRLYHALMEALITDEDAMDKEVADKVKDHTRGKHIVIEDED
ncbi:hypothetical protein Tco_0214104 [Tanacetum coccineum]